MNYEPTINGLTKKTARQLGDAYHTIAEAFDEINSLSASVQAGARLYADLGRDIHAYNNAARQAKLENDKLREEIRFLKKEDEPKQAAPTSAEAPPTEAQA